jgi:hypothetical protein
MDNELQKYEPAAKLMAATAVSQSFSFCMERKYLQNIERGELFSLEAVPSTIENDAAWICISQVGKPLKDDAESCFTAIQKILYSCFIPKEMQLLFLVIGEQQESHLFLGLRNPGKGLPAKGVVKNLNEFILGVWPGLKTEIVSGDNDNIKKVKEALSTDRFENVYALTGIPSMNTQYKTLYPATIDKLIAGMNKSKGYAYLVVADPVPTDDTEDMLFQCREMNGQAESLKSMNVTEGLSHGTSSSNTTSHTSTQSTSVSESRTVKDFSKLGKAAMTASGLGLAASVFPAAGAVLEGCANAAGMIASTALSAVGAAAGIGLGSLVSNLTPSNTTGTTNTTGTSDTTSETVGTTESKSQSVSRNIVSKHIEAVSEHLFFHSNRLETGKAIGLWKVGVYLMGEKKSDLQGGALQLRSILSGQESIYEPIRIHDISAILDEPVSNKLTLREQTLGHFNAPVLSIMGNNGRIFEHPLGNHYKELKTVLTTKELSYLINFPLKSVPGISVIDSAPDFSLNKPQFTEDAKILHFGKLLYGGTETTIEYPLSIDSLSKHTLLSGINGTGKTNTVQAILNSISGKIPFLVIEPAKTEYVDWAIEYNKAHQDNPITIYIPGCKAYKDKITQQVVTTEKLKLNPFEVVWLDKDQEPNVLSHIDRVKSSFAAAFPMYDILPVLMEDLIYTVYQNPTSDWLTSEPEFGKTLAPTLNSMSISVDKVLQHRGYEEKVERNMKACLNTRIDSLKRGWKGEMLNTIKSTSWEKLFEKPCIINLSYVGDDVDKSFFMALILQFLYEYRTACAEIGLIDYNNNGCNHLTVIEEAHRVMMKCDNPELPQYKSAMTFSNMLSEIRAYGEGMFLVDQVPTRLIPDAIKNTNTKITHRLVAEDDVKAIAESMGIGKEQRQIIPKLLVGQCIVSTALSAEKHWIKVNKVK